MLSDQIYLKGELLFTQYVSITDTHILVRLVNWGYGFGTREWGTSSFSNFQPKQVTLIAVEVPSCVWHTEMFKFP